MSDTRPELGKRTDAKWREKREAILLRAQSMPHGRERDDLLRQARQLETACHVNEWIGSAGLRTPG
jgi:hypothetical protein